MGTEALTGTEGTSSRCWWHQSLFFHFTSELTVADRRQKREIRQLEQELHKWQVLVDSITGMGSPDFDNQTLAVLRGRMVRYLMRSREITLGRATKDNQIDVDLSLEGPAWKISRKQGVPTLPVPRSRRELL